MLEKLKAQLKVEWACLWAYLDGKKRSIACMWWGLAMPVYALVQANGATVPKWLVIVVGAIGLIFTYAGLGHQYVKSTITPPR